MSEIYPETPMSSPAAPGPRVLSGVDAPAELAAAMRETRVVLGRYQELCREFGPSAQSGWSARISLTVLNRHRRDAQLDRLSRTPSNDREDTMLLLRRERDEARADLAELRELIDAEQPTLASELLAAREQLAEIRAMVRAAPAVASAEQLGIVLRAIHDEARPEQQQ